MKKLILLSIAILMISSCISDQDEITTRSQEYNKEFLMRLGDKVSFIDGNAFEIKVITDLFCCCSCFCPYIGGLEILIETQNASGEKELVYLGTGDLDHSHEIFDQHRVREIRYTYNGITNGLPVCPPSEFDPNLVELAFVVSKK